MNIHSLCYIITLGGSLKAAFSQPFEAMDTNTPSLNKKVAILCRDNLGLVSSCQILFHLFVSFTR